MKSFDSLKKEIILSENAVTQQREEEKREGREKDSFSILQFFQKILLL